MGGNEDQALITDGVRSAQWLGGFVEVSYVPNFNWLVYGRWERDRTTQAGTDTVARERR